MMSSGTDLRRALDEMANARERLLAMVARLSPGEFALARPGGWSVARVLQHVIESEVIYAKVLAHQCGRAAPDLDVHEPRDAADAASMLAATRDAVERMVDGIDGETLYRLVRLGHEEYSPLSVLENIAAHDVDHRGQIASLAGGGQPAPAGEPLRRPPADLLIRAAEERDLERINEIYNHYILSTPITFDIEPWTIDARHAWFAKCARTGRHRLLVAEDAGAVVGFAGTSQFRAKAAYDTTVETTLYCAPQATGRGIGRALYERLFEELRGEDIRMAVAGITLPNDASARLHESFGFVRAGLFHAVGRKFDRYWDVLWMEREMG